MLANRSSDSPIILGIFCVLEYVQQSECLIIMEEKKVNRAVTKRLEYN